MDILASHEASSSEGPYGDPRPPRSASGPPQRAARSRYLRATGHVPTSGSVVGQRRNRMRAAPMSPGARNAADLYGIATHGSPRPIPFVRPYRWVGQLTDVESVKLDRHPFEAIRAVVEHYAKEGPQAIAAVAGEAERLKWAGLYSQRQGGDAFMLRIKIPG